MGRVMNANDEETMLLAVNPQNAKMPIILPIGTVVHRALIV